MTYPKLKTLYKLLSEYRADLRSGPVNKPTEAEPLAADIIAVILQRINGEAEDAKPEDKY
jgi:hypothetical protein